MGGGIMSEISDLMHKELNAAFAQNKVDWVKVKEILVEILDVLTKVSGFMPSSFSKEIVAGILTLLGICISYLPSPEPRENKVQ
jgi:hypothetical protein